MLSLKGSVPLPYSIEYAKSGRSKCKKCKKCIAEGTLRMAVCEPSSYFDGNVDNWYHFPCFWRYLNPKRDEINLRSIRNVEGLRWEDQEALRERIANFKAPRADSELDSSFSGRLCRLPMVKTDISITNRGKCQRCGKNFEKGETKMSEKGPGQWAHAACLFAAYDRFHGQLEEIPGWENIEAEERIRIAGEFSKIPDEKRTREKIEVEEVEEVEAEEKLEKPRKSAENTTIKRAACVDLEEEDEEEAEKRRKIGKEAKLAALRQQRMKRQVDRLWEYRQIFETMTNSDKKVILKENDQDIPEGHDTTALLIDRLVDNALFGCPIGCSQCADGKIVYNSTRRTYVCTGYATEYSKCTYEDRNPVRTPFHLPDSIRKMYRMSEWTFNDMFERLYLEEEQLGEHVVVREKKHANPGDGDFIYAAEAFDANCRVPVKIGDVLPGTSTHIIKNGTVVDAKCPYADRCHVLKEEPDGALFQATLSFTDVTQNKNSYYKIQLLKEDCKDIYYVFRSWGRVGTDVGDTRTECFIREDAIKNFEKVFFEKTKNEWKYRKHFRKMPGMFSFVETDFSEFEELKNTDVLPGSRTRLPQSVKEIMMSIFDVENMKSALKSFEMDVNKMPLGRLSRKQILRAFGVLTELGELLAEFPVNAAKIVDATNKFYTIIPHNFGMKVPEQIDSLHKVKEKNNMLNALLDIKYAYDQICGGEDPKGGLVGRDPVDTNYEKLKCTLAPLERSSTDWKHIEEYMNNTRGSTHDVDVELIDILRVDRESEAAKFKRGLANRMLLWHGSGKMNFAGILGQGLRIAPPEAPVSGYMFGKGVYFADMFTKSFFYCRASHRDEAYLLLCDVALGEVCPLMAATTMSAKTLPKGTASVKGLGRESPDPTGNFSHSDGYVIPKGHKIINFDGRQYTDYHLLYNEYIVYDVDQIQLKYLVRVKLLNHACHR
ncbi:unnamed protein product [Caenorhabditis sp. 36 PRJEB53466]|nr:unnamed protein product [Caenorhabditis sp. 36 PRJEB53466]